MEIHERIALFYEQLEVLPPFVSHDHALQEIGRVLTEIEDQHSGVPRDLSDTPEVTGGRMYPPHALYAKQTDLPGVILYTQKGHRTYIGNGGAVLIINRRTGAVEFEKPGIGGERIER
jgi:hypothetical protein